MADAAVLALLSEISTMDSLACQESALHGLGHWSYYYRAQVRKIIDGYLAGLPEGAALRRLAWSNKGSPPAARPLALRLHIDAQGDGRVVAPEGGADRGARLGAADQARQVGGGLDRLAVQRKHHVKAGGKNQQFQRLALFLTTKDVKKGATGAPWQEATRAYFLVHVATML